MIYPLFLGWNNFNLIHWHFLHPRDEIILSLNSKQHEQFDYLRQRDKYFFEDYCIQKKFLSFYKNIFSCIFVAKNSSLLEKKQQDNFIKKQIRKFILLKMCINSKDFNFYVERGKFELNKELFFFHAFHPKCFFNAALLHQVPSENKKLLRENWNLCSERLCLNNYYSPDKSEHSRELYCCCLVRVRTRTLAFVFWRFSLVELDSWTQYCFELQIRRQLLTCGTLSSP